MTQYLWSKSEPSTPTHQRIQQFMSGNDVVLDAEIFLYDILATFAHAGGLESIGVLDAQELKAIRDALNELSKQFQSSEYHLGPPFEDGHSAIEFWLTEKLGSVGQKVHTGRSRNDQVQVAMRMYLRDQMHRLDHACQALATVCLHRADADAMTPMPGYTHLQRAVPSSVGLWMASFAESFIDIAELSSMTGNWIDCCPLGTAAGYGVNLPLDRE
ncbi:MAG: lyase family protein, partial [Pirellulaceae bacterium]|nr:lyase family protein [Pirellulaceae bacterium]